MILTFKNLNIPILAAKTEGPSTIIQFMGIILDSGKLEATLPEDKVERIKSALSTYHSQPSTTLQELQSLIGTHTLPLFADASGSLGYGGIFQQR